MKKTLTNILGGIVTATALAGCAPSADYSISSNMTTANVSGYSQSREDLKERLETPNYSPTLEDFKIALGPERLIPEREGELKESWKRSTKKEKRVFTQIYIDPEFIRKLCDTEEKKDYDNFNVLRDLDKTTFKKYQERVPWKNNPKKDKAYYFLVQD